MQNATWANEFNRTYTVAQLEKKQASKKNKKSNRNNRSSAKGTGKGSGTVQKLTPPNYVQERSELMGPCLAEIEQLNEEKRNLQELHRLNEEYQNLISELSGFEEQLENLQKPGTGA